MAEVVERGDISFFFRPAVQPADALVTTLGVQSFFFVLGSEHGLHRRIRVGKKRMPTRGKRYWARVERTGSLQRVLARPGRPRASPVAWTSKARSSCSLASTKNRSESLASTCCPPSPE